MDQKSFDAAIYTDAKLLEDLEVIGVKNVYRQPTNKARVCFAFDSEKSYIKAVTTRGLFMGSTRLNMMGITPYSRLDETKYNNGKTRQRSPNRYQNSTKATSQLKASGNCATGSNSTPLGCRGLVTKDSNNRFAVLSTLDANNVPMRS